MYSCILYGTYYKNRISNDVHEHDDVHYALRSTIESSAVSSRESRHTTLSTEAECRAVRHLTTRDSSAHATEDSWLCHADAQTRKSTQGATPHNWMLMAHVHVRPSSQLPAAEPAAAIPVYLVSGLRRDVHVSQRHSKQQPCKNREHTHTHTHTQTRTHAQ